MATFLMSARASRIARLALLLGGLAIGAQLSAEPTPIALDWQDANSVHPRAVVCAVRRTSPDPAGGHCEAEAVTSAETTLELAAGAWTLRAETQGFWSPTVD